MKVGDLVQLKEGLIPYPNLVEITWVGGLLIEFDGGWARRSEVVKVIKESK
tara:strand:+ start:145 stop:297 length:153 start_codon:yes stop_codon:yes gene_type:complete